MPEYRVKKPFRFKGKAYMSGTVKDIPEPQASMLAERGFLEPSGIPEVEEIEEIKPGVNLDQFLEQARTEGGVWIRSAEVAEGDTLEVLGPGEVDDETFDRPYLVLPVRYKGEERRLRLGVRNVERIKRVLGSNTAGWTGKKIKVTAVEVVPGLTKQRGVETKRMILDGVG